uniref:S-acyltransferase n=1 Tax=Kalanchoe fedtschenkoi TaxID=63787 RepID=A0A7N0TL54_KALFE
MKLRSFGSFPVILVVLVIGFEYYGTVFLLIESWLGLGSSAGWWNGFIYTLLALLALLSFLVCVLTDPGPVPSGYLPDAENQDPSAYGQQHKQCDKCHTYKPPRAHHCRICRRCILRMDHHCIWINNCVGHWNYKSFVNLVFYATIGSVHATVMITRFALQHGLGFADSTTFKTVYVAYGVLAVALSLVLGTLLGWHIYLVLHNMTTIEYYESTRAAWLARKSGQNYRHPFNLNSYKNISLR